jgi:hypothetical protein
MVNYQEVVVVQWESDSEETEEVPGGENDDDGCSEKVLQKLLTRARD